MSEISDPRIEQITFAPGDTLFFENEESYHFFVIQEGEVEVSKTDESGKRIVLGVMREGTSLGEFAMLDKKPRSATCKAITRVVAAKVSEEAYKELITELPEWAVAVMRGMIDRLRHTNDIIRRSSAAASVKDEVSKVIEGDVYEDEFGSNPFLNSSDD